MRLELGRLHAGAARGRGRLPGRRAAPAAGHGALKRRDAAAEAAESSGCIWLHLQMQEWNRIVVVELVVLKLVVILLKNI